MKRSMWSQFRAIVISVGLAVLGIAPIAANGTQQAGGTATDGGYPDTGKSLVFMVSEHPSITYNEKSATVSELMNRVGVKFEELVIPSSDYNVKRNAMLASNDIPDLLRVDFAAVQQYAHDGLFVNLSESKAQLPNYFALVERAWDAMKFFTVDGSYYHFARTAKANPVYLAGPMIREDMLQKVGMAVPTSFGELHDVLAAFKAADPGSIPWSTRGDTFVSTIAYSFGSGNGVYFDEAVGGGTYLYAPIHQQYADLLRYLHSLYSEGLIDPDYNVISSAQWQENMSSGKSYFFYDNTTFTANFNKVLRADDSSRRFVPMATLSNDYGQRRAFMYAGVGRDSPTSDGYAVSADSANIGGALRLMDYMYSEDGSTLMSWGIEGDHYTVENGERVVAQSWIDRFASMGDPWRAFQAFIGTGTLIIDPYYDNYSSFAFLSDDEIAMYNFWTSDEAIGPWAYLPTLSAEESDRMVQLRSTLDTLVSTESSKFVLGLRPLGELNDFMNELLAAGGAEVEKIYAAAYSRIE